ncbi:MAG: glycine--tRNA ligase subunit beta [Synergistaceae bacterium]|jgi:glycyl-tRNA synthetase beta chain|nr:glycine--tRNA ligase subunit beta [Synergistaceae bacterium]
MNPKETVSPSPNSKAGSYDVVLEIGTEEIPSRFITPMLEILKTLAAEDLKQLRIACKDVRVYATPRRLVLCLHGLAERQEDLVAAYKGPPWASTFDASGNATRAAEGFAKSKGVAIDDLKEVDVDGTAYAVAEVREAGGLTKSFLPGFLSGLIGKLVFPKNMFWRDPAIRFARPIRWIVALAGDEVVPFAYGDVQSGRTSSGHRFMGNKQIQIKNTDEFLGKLYDNYVILDQEKRKQKLLAGIASLEREYEGIVELDPELVEENLYLVEYPVPFMGGFSERFLKIPQEVLVTTMKKNQKYFAVRTKEGKLMNAFVGVANNRAVDMSIIREGNERVLRARLEDAAFFWAEDRKHSLGENVERLKEVVYQEKLGSLHAKVMATQKLAVWLCGELNMPELSKLVERAAFLSKADLVTHMVYEFPELQGVMGREYASASGEDPRVALAIYEQYLPKSVSDEAPSDDVGAILGLAERVHIIVSCHKVGLGPTGSQDPYALRRAARCVNEIIWARKLDVDVKEAVRTSALTNLADMAVVDEVFAFLDQRLLVQVKDKGYEHDLTKLAISVAGHRPLQTLRLVQTLNKVKDEPWFIKLVMSAVRVRNILHKAGEVSDVIDPDLMAKPAEKNLYEGIVKMEPLVATALRGSDWEGLATSLSELSPVVAGFFDDVMVMDPDEKIRANRLGILKRCNALFEEVGDLSVLKS